VAEVKEIEASYEYCCIESMNVCTSLSFPARLANHYVGCFVEDVCELCWTNRARGYLESSVWFTRNVVCTGFLGLVAGGMPKCESLENTSKIEVDSIERERRPSENAQRSQHAF
jgi:hypothetical protein